MHEQHRRRLALGVAGLCLRQIFGADEHAGVAEDRRRGEPAAQAHMQRHHGALAEAHQREAGIVEPVLFELRVEKSVQTRLRGDDAPPALVGRAGVERKPLPP